MILPWVDDPQPFGFDADVDSIAVSGHKCIGPPMSCVVVLWSALQRRGEVERQAGDCCLTLDSAGCSLMLETSRF